MVSFSQLSATGLTRHLRERSITAVELLAYFEQRFSDLNPAINAIVTTDFEGGG